MGADYRRHLKWLGLVAFPLINIVLSVVQNRDGGEVLLYAVILAWGIWVGVAVTILAYSFGSKEPRLRTKKTYLIPAGDVILRFHMKVARDLDDPISSSAGALCARDETPLAVHRTGFSALGEPSYWECPVCGTQSAIVAETIENARAIALKKWRDGNPSDE